jgi:hypothetical protein
MRRNAYILAFLTFWVQFDDLLLAALSTAGQSAPLPGSNEEEGFLPPKRQARPQQSSLRRQPKTARPKAQAAVPNLVGKCLPSKWNLATPFAPPPLYVFMSLQF